MSVAGLFASLAAGVAVLLWRPPASWWLRWRLGAGPPAPAAVVARGRRLASRVPRARWVVVATVAAAPWLVASPAAAVLLGTGAAVAAVVLTVVRRGRERRARTATAAEVTEALDLLAGELRAGAPAPLALAGVGGETAVLAGAAAVAARGGDVATALRAGADRPGAEHLVAVAAAWEVAEATGAPVAQVLGRVAEHAREDEALAEEIRAESSPARSTGRLMAFLPLVGLALGSGLGGDPVAVVTGTLVGALCVAAGAACALAGLWWVERIADAAEEGR